MLEWLLAVAWHAHGSTCEQVMHITLVFYLALSNFVTLHQSLQAQWFCMASKIEVHCCESRLHYAWCNTVMESMSGVLQSLVEDLVHELNWIAKAGFVLLHKIFSIKFVAWGEWTLEHSLAFAYRGNDMRTTAPETPKRPVMFNDAVHGHQLLHNCIKKDCILKYHDQ